MFFYQEKKYLLSIKNILILINPRFILEKYVVCLKQDSYKKLTLKINSINLIIFNIK